MHRVKRCCHSTTFLEHPSLLTLLTTPTQLEANRHPLLEL